jgi:hypothetical protein
MGPVMKVATVIHSKKGKYLIAIKDFSFRSKKFLLTIWNDGVVLTKNVNAT